MNDVENQRLLDILDGVLRSMAGSQGPSALEPRIRFELDERETTADVVGATGYLFSELLSENPNSPVHAVFARQLRSWDAASESEWTLGTRRLTAERRALVCNRLKLDAALKSGLLTRIPIAKSFDNAVLIAPEHEHWYTAIRKSKYGTFYWTRYEQYLRDQAGWDETATASLNESTDLVLKCLSDPERPEAYAVRGLVVGYVQSGKTANFTAVIAKALDAGYRLVIVFAGVLDSLRFQTQRRLDKELIGREQILRDQEEGQPHEYSGDQDWEKFASYGSLPSELGAFDLRRITTSITDYKKLGQGRDVLKFEKRYPDRPLNHPDNLRSGSARIVVIKKHPAVINKFVADMKGLKIRLDDIPAIVIDDESDQASVNAINPRKPKKESSRDGESAKERTATNGSIVKLLAMLPRSQYVGYTATPAANTLINPSDSEDLFPRDFIELLPRPANYMGVADFHDFDEDFNPLSQEEVDELGFRSNESAFVRAIKAADDSATFREALDAFFLTGALKLFRASRDLKAVNTRHHTMLVHRAMSRDAHEEDRLTVRSLLAKNAYRKKSSFARLWRLWLVDFEPVSLVQQPDLERPGSLEELTPFIEQALSRFEDAGKQVLIVNGRDANRDDMPDFDKESVWNILIGGAKLSRGYTVEGLTISYFLRRATAADTLMQMGRWFGFRRGYRDLVRLYIGTEVAAGKHATADLYEMFESICMDEERFRKRIALYSRDGIKPIQVPPLVPMGMMIPTAKNKMYNAEIEMENFGGKVAESGRVPTKPADRVKNVDALAAMLAGHLRTEVTLWGHAEAKGSKHSLLGDTFRVDPQQFLAFLSNYRWSTKESQFSTVIGFLSGTGEDSAGIDTWLIAVLTNPSSEGAWGMDGRKYGVFQRAVVNDRFSVFSESRHRHIAKHLTSVKQLHSANAQLRELTRPRQAVCLIYPTMQIVEKAPTNSAITVGLSLVFPENRIRQRMNWRVRDPSHNAPAFVEVPGS